MREIASVVHVPDFLLRRSCVRACYSETHLSEESKNTFTSIKEMRVSKRGTQLPGPTNAFKTCLLWIVFERSGLSTFAGCSQQLVGVRRNRSMRTPENDTEVLLNSTIRSTENGTYLGSQAKIRECELCGLVSLPAKFA